MSEQMSEKLLLDPLQLPGVDLLKKPQAHDVLSKRLVAKEPMRRRVFACVERSRCVGEACLLKSGFE